MGKCVSRPANRSASLASFLGHLQCNIGYIPPVRKTHLSYQGSVRWENTIWREDKRDKYNAVIARYLPLNAGALIDTCNCSGHVFCYLALRLSPLKNIHDQFYNSPCTDSANFQEN